MTKRKAFLTVMMAAFIAGTALAQLPDAGVSAAECPVLLDANGNEVGPLFDPAGNRILMQSSAVPGHLLVFFTRNIGLQGNASVYFTLPNCTGDAHMFFTSGNQSDIINPTVP